MQNILFKKQPQLRISHQSEVLLLKKALADLQTEMMMIKQQMNHVDASSRQRKITLSSNGQHHFIALDDILYCEADGNYTKVFICQGNSTLTSADFGYRSVAGHSQRFLLISKTLKATIDLISSDDFIRCHQSFLVNKKHVTGYAHDNRMQLTLNNGTSIPVSRRNKKEVLGIF